MKGMWGKDRGRREERAKFATWKDQVKEKNLRVNKADSDLPILSQPNSLNASEVH